MIEQAKKLFLIGGASGVGKSMLAEEIASRGIAVYKKIHSFAFDIAKDKNCELRAVFDKNFFVAEAVNRMIVFIKKHLVVVSDLHYAIQPRADTLLFLEGKVDNEVLSTEEYKAAFTPKDFKPFIDNHITLIPLLITCEADQLIQRKIQTSGRTVKGGADKKIAQRELSAELKFYKSITKGLNVKPYIFDNSEKELHDFHREVISQLKTPI